MKTPLSFAIKQLIINSVLLIGLTHNTFAAEPQCFEAGANPIYPATTNKTTLTPAADASRFLNMATFGTNQRDLNHLTKMTIQQWLDEQFAMDMSCHLDELNQTQNNNERNNRLEVWFRLSVTAPDQLRQRVAFALSELFVVSDVGSNIPAHALAVYYDILVKNAFGNFRDILEQVTLSPAMGRYLSMLGNQKASKIKGIRADENYAREIMQLFTVGLVQLDNSGVPLMQNNLPIPTYNQSHVEALARVFTGWTWGDSYSFTDGGDWRVTMKAFTPYHDKDVKSIINNVVVAANNTPQKDLDFALDTLFKHPNVAPFVSKSLIQRLVTSNPSPAYIGRVAAKFNNNGKGVRGDMQAVINAIFTDTEALTGVKANKDFGKLREPVLAVTHLWRAFDASSFDNRMPYDYADTKIGQAPLSAPSVFNFFKPDYAPSGVIKKKALVAPEFQLINEANNTRFYNELYNLINNHKAISWSVYSTQISIKELIKRANSMTDLLNYLDLLLMGAKMPDEMKTIIQSYIRTIPLDSGDRKGIERSVNALYLVMSSPYYLIQR
jgi:uncharacterized protein (DUF1800 family)